MTQYDIPLFGTYLFFKNKLLNLFIEDIFYCLVLIGYHALKDGVVLGLLARIVLLFN